jgi:hypothetical protein
MATMLERCITEEQRSVVLFLFVGKGLNAMDIHQSKHTYTGTHTHTHTVS